MQKSAVITVICYTAGDATIFAAGLQAGSVTTMVAAVLFFVGLIFQLRSFNAPAPEVRAEKWSDPRPGEYYRGPSAEDLDALHASVAASREFLRQARDSLSLVDLGPEVLEALEGIDPTLKADIAAAWGNSDR